MFSACLVCVFFSCLIAHWAQLHHWWAFHLLALPWLFSGSFGDWFAQSGWFCASLRLPPWGCGLVGWARVGSFGWGLVFVLGFLFLWLVPLPPPLPLLPLAVFRSPLLASLCGFSLGPLGVGGWLRVGACPFVPWLVLPLRLVPSLPPPLLFLPPCSPCPSPGPWPGSVLAWVGGNLGPASVPLACAVCLVRHCFLAFLGRASPDSS